MARARRVPRGDLIGFCQDCPLSSLRVPLFRSGWIAIRAARFGPEADFVSRGVGEKPTTKGISMAEKKRGANKDSFAFPIVPFQCLSAPQHSF